MRIRPVQVWWLGVGLFMPSILIWVMAAAPDGIGEAVYGNAHWQSRTLTQVWLPLLAAVVGFSVPLACLRLLKRASWQVNAWVFFGYLSAMFTWAAIDIRYEHAQGSGSGEHDGLYVVRNFYFTWYFVPDKWTTIEQRMER